MVNSVPFNRATVASNQEKYVLESMKSGHISGDGSFTKKATSYLSGVHKGKNVLLTTSCTSALEMCAILLEIKTGDEVIVPSFTFVSSANAFVLSGAKIVFVDIDKLTWNISPQAVKQAISPKTRAIIAVNYAGHPAVTAEMLEIAKHYGIPIIEDNAHGLFAKDNQSPLGTKSAMSTLSFHETKNVTCGEGGALVINEPNLIERAEIIREKGTNRSKYFRGAVDKYTWMDKGSSYVLSDINAAILLAQLEESNSIQIKRQEAFKKYMENLAEWALKCGALLPHHLNSPESSFHMFPVVMPDLDARTRLISTAKKLNVSAVFHYVPLHSSPGGKRFGRSASDCPNTDYISDRIVRLPLFSDIRYDEIEKVITAIQSFVN
jgi:dTDP-4-amino-4,6-dideoxygalactose transaminase